MANEKLSQVSVVYEQKGKTVEFRSSLERSENDLLYGRTISTICVRPTIY